jgi:hypothetical protein
MSGTEMLDNVQYWFLGVGPLLINESSFYQSLLHRYAPRGIRALMQRPYFDPYYLPNLSSHYAQFSLHEGSYLFSIFIYR